MANFLQGDNALSTLFEPKIKIAYGTFKIGKDLDLTHINAIGESWSPTSNITVTQSQDFLSTHTTYFRIITAGIYKLQLTFRFLSWRDEGTGVINIHLGSSSVAGGNSCPNINDIYSMHATGAGRNKQYGIFYMDPNDDTTNATYQFRAEMVYPRTDSNFFSVDITFQASANYDIYPAASYDSGDDNPVSSMIQSKWMITKLI